jgi:regulator of sigma E protease
MSIILFFVILFVLVIAHEFGHFIVAKKAGIRVDEFAFGFPPKLFGKKWGETTYSFNALPLGGYVKIYGENPDEVDDSDRKRSFIGKPRIIQALVIVAGIFFNLILAWVLLAAVLMIGIASPVDEANSKYVDTPQVMITGVHPGTPAEAAGLRAGDVVTHLSDGRDSIDVTTTDNLSDFIGVREGRSVTITYERKDEIKEATITPVSGLAPNGAAIGIYMDLVGILQLPLHKALWEGAIKTYQYTEMTAVGIYTFLMGAIMGQGDFSQVTGPVGIVNAVGDAANVGFANLLLFTALISINLAVINVIPFPALDGGRLLFIGIEAVMRRQITPVIANTFNLVGFALLMLLMLAVTWHDVANLVK